MTRPQIFLLGMITALTVFWPALAPIYYVPLVVSFGLYSLLIFPAIVGIASVMIIRMFKSATMTMDVIIEKINFEALKKWLAELSKKGRIYAFMARAPIYVLNKIKTERLKNTLIKFLTRGGWFALVGSAFFLCPFIVPVVAKTCIKDEKKLYLITVILNVVMTIFWNCAYVLGWEMIKALFKFKLSL